MRGWEQTVLLSLFATALSFVGGSSGESAVSPFHYMRDTSVKILSKLSRTECGPTIRHPVVRRFETP